MRRRTFPPMACILLAILAVVGPASGQDRDLVADEWSLLTMLGKESGNQHLVMRWVERDGERVLHTKVDVTLEMKRMGQSIKVATSVETIEAPDGTLRWARTVQEMSNVATISEVLVGDETAEVSSTVYGRTISRTVPWVKNVLGPYGMNRLHAENVGQTGSRYEYKLFLPEFGARFVNVKAEVVGPTEKTVLGKKGSYVEVHEDWDVLPGLTVQTWFDGDVRPAVQHTPIAGGVEVILVDRDRAHNLNPEGAGDLDPDALIELSAQANVSLAYPYRTQSVLYRITVKRGSVEAMVERLKSERQTVVKVDGNAIILHVRSQESPSDVGFEIPHPRTPEFEEYLVGNSWLQSDDPIMRAEALEVVGEEKDAWRAAKKLEKWVYEKIGNKNMNVGFASAREVLDNPEGDCTEHAVLLAAALRSAGIPSRVAMGFLYFNTRYAGHAWTEAFVGEWIPLDGTMARPFVGATHIDFGRSTLTDEGLETLFLDIAQALGNFKIDILEYNLDGRRVKIEPGVTAYVVSGARYRNEIYGIELVKPAGWEYRNLDDVGFGKKLLEIVGQNGEKVSIGTQALPYNQDFFALVDQISRKGEPIRRDTIEIGGRAGEYLVLAKKDRPTEKEVFALVTVDELLFVFHTEYEGEEDVKNFRRVLDSVSWL